MPSNSWNAQGQQSYTAEELRLTIARLEHVLAEINAIASSYDRRSDLGWLFSMIANEAGTLAAVTMKRKAQQWDAARREIEQHLQRLRAELRLQEHAAHRAAHAENIGRDDARFA